MTPLEPSPPRRSLWPRLLLAALFAAAFALFYLCRLDRFLNWDYLGAHRDSLRMQAHEHLLLSLLLFFVLYATATAFSVPAAWLLTVLAGAIFDRWLGTAVSNLGATCGATLAFLSSRYLLQDVVQRRFGDRLRKLNEGVEKDGAYYLLTLRLVPLVPFFLINLGMGLTKLRLRTFMWVSSLGMLPAGFLYCNAGEQLCQLQSASGLLSPTVLISLALLGIVPLLLRKLLSWYGTRAE